MKFFWHTLSKIFRKNFSSTPVSVISDQLNEVRPLPIGKSEFDAWSDRIISGALLPADSDSQKFALANELLSLGPTEDHKPDIYFIKLLRKFAVNQVADAQRTEIRDRVKARLEAQRAAAQPDPAATDGSQTKDEATSPTTGVTDGPKSN
jgi:hypothetical protein